MKDLIICVYNIVKFNFLKSVSKLKRINLNFKKYKLIITCLYNNTSNFLI